METPHDKIMEKQALDTMDVNAEIVDSGLQIKHMLQMRGKYNSGAAGVPRNRKESSKFEIDDSKDLEYFLYSDDEERLEFVNEELLDSNPLSSYESVSNFSFQPIVTIYLEVNYFNGMQITIQDTIKPTPKTLSHPLLRHYVSTETSEIKITTEIENDVHILFEETKYTFKKTDSPSLSVDSDMEKFMYTYLSTEERWPTGGLQVTQTEENIIIDFLLPNHTVSHTFSPPFFDMTGLRKLMNIFNCSDPLNLDSRRFEFTFPWASSLGHKYKLLKIRPKNENPSATAELIDSAKRNFNYYISYPLLNN